jgi:hypothetical protein
VAVQHIIENDPVGPTGKRHASEGAVVADDLLAGAIHGAQPGAAREHERAVDVEQEELSSTQGVVHYEAQEER